MKKGAAILFCWMLLLSSASSPATRGFHYAFWSDDPQRYLGAIQKGREAPGTGPAPAAGENLRAGIVTHHFLASGLMVRFFEKLRTAVSPETIVLIGPNHFHHGRANIAFSCLPWKTPFGRMDVDCDTVRQIEAATSLAEDREAFSGEHSVGVLLPMLKYYFPRSRVAPLLIDANAEERKLASLRGVLTSLLRNPKVLVLLSMDFSHNSDSPTADARDETAERVLSRLDADDVSELNVDCHKGLWLLLAALRDLGNVTAHIQEHSNSSRLTGNPRQANVTSYFTVSFGRRIAVDSN